MTTWFAVYDESLEFIEAFESKFDAKKCKRALEKKTQGHFFIYKQVFDSDDEIVFEELVEE